MKEQGEEETNAHDLITKMDLFGSDPKSLYMLDSELKARVYAAPSLGCRENRKKVSGRKQVNFLLIPETFFG